MSDKIVTCIWYDGTAEEAARFYVSLGLPESRMGAVHRSPADNPSMKEGGALVAEFTLDGHPYIGLNGGPQFPHTEAVSLQVMTDDQAETDRLWAAFLDNGGTESECGWLKDRWGLSWQITPRRLTQLMADPNPDRARAAMQAMMTMRKIDIATLDAAADAASPA